MLAAMLVVVAAVTEGALRNAAVTPGAGGPVVLLQGGRWARRREAAVWV